MALLPVESQDDCCERIADELTAIMRAQSDYYNHASAFMHILKPHTTNEECIIGTKNVSQIVNRTLRFDQCRLADKKLIESVLAMFNSASIVSGEPAWVGVSIGNNDGVAFLTKREYNSYVYRGSDTSVLGASAFVDWVTKMTGNIAIGNLNDMPSWVYMPQSSGGHFGWYPLLWNAWVQDKFEHNGINDILIDIDRATINRMHRSLTRSVTRTEPCAGSKKRKNHRYPKSTSLFALCASFGGISVFTGLPAEKFILYDPSRECKEWNIVPVTRTEAMFHYSSVLRSNKTPLSVYGPSLNAYVIGRMAYSAGITLGINDIEHVHRQKWIKPPTLTVFGKDHVVGSLGSRTDTAGAIATQYTAFMALTYGALRIDARTASDRVAKCNVPSVCNEEKLFQRYRNQYFK